MLAKRQYARHAIRANLTIPTLFLFLFLISLSPIATANCCPSSNDANSNQITPASDDLILSANSKMHTNGGMPICGTMVLPAGRMRWEMKNPSGGIVYFIEPKVYGDWPNWCVDDQDLYVPAFPQQGRWKVELWAFDPIFKLYGKNMVTWNFDVGESSITDNIMAPIYLTYGGVPVVGWGAFSISLPGIFWLTSPLWILGIFFILLAIYVRSIKAAIALIKEGMGRFKEGFKGGTKT